MDTHLSERRGGRAGVAYRVLVALLAATALLLAPAAASAHDTLSESSPSDGDVGPSPEQVVLTFTGDVGSIGTAVEVTGPQGTAGAGEPVVEGRTVTVPLAPDLPAGDYTVSWRVTSADGHPISGEFGFGVEAEEATEPTTEPTSAPTSAPTAEPTDEGATAEETSETGTTTSSAPATAEPADTPTPEATPVTAEGEGDGGGVSPWVWVLAGLVVLGLAGVVVAVARRSPDVE
jgi:copper resistance protein C